MIFIANYHTYIIRTLFYLDFCINPSMKGTLRPKHKGRINAKLQYDVELMVQQQVVMIFIANYKEMIRYLLFSTFA